MAKARKSKLEIKFLLSVPLQSSFDIQDIQALRLDEVTLSVPVQSPFGLQDIQEARLDDVTFTLLGDGRGAAFRQQVARLMGVAE
jgi:hypothetical protein